MQRDFGQQSSSCARAAQQNHLSAAIQIRQGATPAASLVSVGGWYLQWPMVDELGNTVACKVCHEALRVHAEREHFAGTDGAVFQAHRELIEELASGAFDAEGPFDNHGRVLVTSEALTRITRSA